MSATPPSSTGTTPSCTSLDEGPGLDAVKRPDPSNRLTKAIVSLSYQRHVTTLPLLHVAVKAVTFVDVVEVVELHRMIEYLADEAADAEGIRPKFFGAELGDEFFLVFSHLITYPFERRQVLLDLGVSQLGESEPVIVCHVPIPGLVFRSR
jgi:hypothetical protein